MDTMVTHYILLLIAVVLWLPAITQQGRVNDCSCQRNSNKYIQLAEEKCEKFTQYDNTTRLTYTHSCPPGLRFSVDTCVCERSQEVACEGCGPPVCEIELNRRFEEVVNLRLTGNCTGGNQLLKDIIESCVVKDPVERTIISLRSIAVRELSTQCPPPVFAEGCEQLPICMTMMLAFEDETNYYREDKKPEFLCENYKEAKKCLRCAEANGCQLVSQYRNNLRVAVEELCPHLQEFTCPADVLDSLL